MSEEIKRIPLGIPILDNVFRGGVIEGSIILVAEIRVLEKPLLRPK